MIEHRGGTRFGHQLLARLKTARDVRRQQLERHRTPECRILRSIDDTHPATAQLALDDEAADTLRHERDYGIGARARTTHRAPRTTHRALEWCDVDRRPAPPT